jgi:hypothetical protein
MIAGFALLDYPTKYGETGSCGIVINWTGNSFQKDLDTIAAAGVSCDPGMSLKVVRGRGR